MFKFPTMEQYAHLAALSVMMGAVERRAGAMKAMEVAYHDGRRRQEKDVSRAKARLLNVRQQRQPRCRRFR